MQTPSNKVLPKCLTCLQLQLQVTVSLLDTGRSSEGPVSSPLSPLVSGSVGLPSGDADLPFHALPESRVWDATTAGGAFDGALAAKSLLTTPRSPLSSGRGGADHEMPSEAGQGPRGIGVVISPRNAWGYDWKKLDWEIWFFYLFFFFLPLSRFW